LDVAKTSILIDFSAFVIALAIPREPPKTIALVITIIKNQL
jgi:hypothetical protein